MGVHLVPRRPQPSLRLARLLALCLALASTQCAPAQPPHAAPLRAAESPADPLRFIENDLPAARALAIRQRKLLLVDAWAPWCHTCLSMRAFVFPDPSLRPLARHVVFAAIDTDQPSSADFLDSYPVHACPSLFILHPASGDVLACWPGSCSAQELKTLVDDAVRVADATAPVGVPLRDLTDARGALAARDLERAQHGFARLLARMNPSWSRWTEALTGAIETLRAAGSFPACADFGAAHLREVSGASRPGDFAAMTLDCAARLPPGQQRSAVEKAAIAMLRDLVNAPAPHASVDDRPDLLGILADDLESSGDHAAALQMHEQRIAMLEQAAAEASTPRAASTFDYLLARSYVAIGRGQDAVRLLAAHELHCGGAEMRCRSMAPKWDEWV
jgi:thiol-disulfide isomerase/thioredoxin